MSILDFIVPEPPEVPPPPPKIEVFAAKIPGNADMPLGPFKEFKELAETPPEREDLPPSVQNAIAQIQSVASMAEKAAIAHNFTLEHLAFEKQFGGNMGAERRISFDELANDPIGDCDDFARFTKGLLMRGGANPDEIFIMGGMMKYESKLGQDQLGHAFLVVQDEEEYLLLDNSLADPAVIDPANPVVTGNLYNGGRTHIEATATIEYLIGGGDGRGFSAENEEASEKLLRHMDAYIKQMEADAQKVSAPAPPPPAPTNTPSR